MDGRHKKWLTARPLSAMHAWSGSLPRYWPAVIDTSLVKGEEVADTMQMPCFLCPRPTGRMNLATLERPLSSRPLPLACASQNIYQGDQHPPIHSSFFLFLSKFCQPQIHLSVFSPLFVFVFFVLELVSPLLSNTPISFSRTPKTFNCQLHQSISVAGQLETR